MKSKCIVATSKSKQQKVFSILCVMLFSLCSIQTIKADDTQVTKLQQASGKKSFPKDSILRNMPFKIEIILEKELIYDQHTLKDEYLYGKIKRKFQWDKIKEKLAFVDSIQRKQNTWGILQNYKNKNGTAPLVKEYKKDAYNKIVDKYGVERDQGIPLYLQEDTLKAEEYGHDGAWAKILNTPDSLSKWVDVQDLMTGKSWSVPRKYVKLLNDTLVFSKIVAIDVKNQNIATLEKVDSKWLIRSMNPSTTGKHSPPHKKETPVGVFVLQEKRAKMFYLVDGTNDIAGFAPYASRFSDGGYIHGVPLVNPNTTLIEYSWTLGTVPRSHMCVRNATSHAKYIYDWAPTQATLIFVID